MSSAIAVTRHASALVVVLGLAACEESNAVSKADEWAGDSLPLLSPTAQIIRIDPALLSSSAMALKPVVRIGTGQAGETDEFGSVAGIAVDAIGRIFVSDPMSARVRVYDPNGAFARDIGRRGRGPGEFWGLHGERDSRALNGIALSGDTLYALDERLIALDTTGTYLFASSPDESYTEAFGIAAARGKVVVVRSPITENDESRYLFSELDPVTMRSIPTVVFRERRVDFGQKGFLYRKPTPLPLLPLTLAANGRIYVANGDSFHVSVIGSDGAVERAYIASVPRVRAAARDIRAVGEDLQQLLANHVNIANPPNVVDMIDAGPQWEFRQAIGALVVSDQGTMLLQRTDISEAPFNRFADGPGVLWAMISSVGHPLANYLLPQSFQARVFLGCQVYGVEVLDGGAQTVVQYDLAVGTAARQCK